MELCAHNVPIPREVQPGTTHSEWRKVITRFQADGPDQMLFPDLNGQRQNV